MDGLALLCTLHADGPATLRVLRQAGCGTLDGLTQLGPERTAELLGLPPAAARRFLREATGLRARVGTDLLEREEAPVDYADARPTPPVLDDEPAAEPATQELGAHDHDLMQRVLSAWRDRDRREGTSQPITHAEAAEILGATPRGADRPPAPAELAGQTTVGPERHATVGPERHATVGPERHATHDPERHATHDPARHATHEPARHAPHEPDTLVSAPEEPTSADLSVGLLDGLTEECCHRLASAGVVDVAGLLEAEPVELSRRTSLGYTLVTRLQFLGRRASAAARPPAPSPARTEAPAGKFSAASTPPLGTRFDFEVLPHDGGVPGPSGPAAVPPARDDAPRETPGGPFAQA